MSSAARPSVYVAGPLGFTPYGALHLADVVLPALVASGFEPLDPWAVDAETAQILARPPGDPHRTERLPAVNRAIGARNAELIRACTAVLAFLDGPDVDSGTAAEIGYAAALGRPVIGVRADLRTSGDNEAAVVNLQVEWFIQASGGVIETNLEAALTALGRLSGTTSV